MNIGEYTHTHSGLFLIFFIEFFFFFVVSFSFSTICLHDDDDKNRLKKREKWLVGVRVLQQKQTNQKNQNFLSCGLLWVKIFLFLFFLWNRPNQRKKIKWITTENKWFVNLDFFFLFCFVDLKIKQYRFCFSQLVGWLISCCCCWFGYYSQNSKKNK